MEIGRVGRAELSDGAKERLRLDRSGAGVVKQLTGQYAESAHRNELFICSTPAAGVTVPIFSNTTQQFVLYNPAGALFKYEVLRAWAGYVSGTHVAGHLCWAYQADATKTVTGTNGLVVGSRLSGTPQSLQVLVAATVTAFTYLRPWQHSQVALTAATAATPWQTIDETDGHIVIEPGRAVAIAASAAAFSVSTLGALVRELPLLAA
jgi:hypothetical protein